MQTNNSIAVPVSGTAPPIGVHQAVMEGRFRSITTHQLCLAWWLHSAGHITRRQLRVYFAAHEMHERRRYAKQDERGRPARRPFFAIEELKSLVGGRGTPSADADLQGDIRRLARLGLVRIEERAIVFAVSADQVNVEDLSGFWEMFEKVPNRARSVPVPRRTLRALAGGFSRAVTAVAIALMIRSLFWRRETNDYRIDGRTKGSWIAETFGLSRRAVTDARARLIELGWLEVLDASQWELNRWGAHDCINVGWTPALPVELQAIESQAVLPPSVVEAIDATTIPPSEAVREGGAEQGGAGGGEAEFASPPSDNLGEFASPIINSFSFPLERNLETRKLDPGSGPAGVSRPHSQEEKATTKPVTLRNIQVAHLQDDGNLLELYRQAIAGNLISDSQAKQLDFFALAERALARGNDPGALFRWLLLHRRFDFITQADEDAAQARLRVMRNGPRERDRRQDSDTKPVIQPLSETDKMVQACLAVAERRGLSDPFTVARLVKSEWTRDDWDAAVMAYEMGRMNRFVLCEQ